MIASARCRWLREQLRRALALACPEPAEGRLLFPDLDLNLHLKP